MVVEVGDVGRTIAVDLASGEAPEEAPAPDVTVRMDLDAFVALAGGRADASAVDDLDVRGDEELAGRVLAAMSMTP